MSTWGIRAVHDSLVTELRHPNMAIKIFVAVIQKEGLDGTSTAKPYFDMTPTQDSQHLALKIICEASRVLNSLRY